MKIAFVMPNTLPMPAVKGGAVETILQNYIDANEKCGHQELTVFCKYDSDAKLASNQYKYTNFVYINEVGRITVIKKIVLGVLNLLSNCRTGNVYIRKVSNKIKCKEFDFVIIENAPYYLPVISRKTRIKSVLHIHNDYSKSMKMIVKKYSDFLLCVSENIKKSYDVDEYNGRLSVLFNCIDIQRFEYDFLAREKLRNQLKIKDDEKVYIYTGRIIEGKGVLELIKAFILALRIVDNIKLMIVGGISYSNNSIDEYMEKCIREANKAKNKIIFTGYIDYKDLADYYSSADIGVIPSMLNEAASLSAIEMIASGLPLIANKIGGLEEMACRGKVRFVGLGRNYIEELSNAIINMNIGKRVKNTISLDDFSISNYKYKLESELKGWTD